MKKQMKKYPFLVSLIISFVIVVASIFVAAFGGIKLNPSLGGGSQFEISISDKSDAKSCVQGIKDVLKEKGVSYDSFTVEDKAKATEEATGFKLRKLKEEVPAKVVPTQEGKKIGLNDIFGFDEKVKPLLSPELKDGDIVLAVYQNDMPAIVQRGKHIFCGIAEIPETLYRYSAKIAGAQIYSKQNISAWASGAYVSITCVDGIDAVHDVEIDIPSDKEIFDAITGEKLGVAPKLTLKMKRGDNRVLRLGKGNAEFVK